MPSESTRRPLTTAEIAERNIAFIRRMRFSSGIRLEKYIEGWRHGCKVAKWPKPNSSQRFEYFFRGIPPAAVFEFAPLGREHPNPRWYDVFPADLISYGRQQYHAKTSATFSWAGIIGGPWVKIDVLTFRKAGDSTAKVYEIPIEHLDLHVLWLARAISEPPSLFTKEYWSRQWVVDKVAVQAAEQVKFWTDKRVQTYEQIIQGIRARS